MKHRPKDVTVRGWDMRKCTRCKLSWLPQNEAMAMETKCPGRSK